MDYVLTTVEYNFTLVEDAGKCQYCANGIIPIPALICTDDLQTL